MASYFAIKNSGGNIIIDDTTTVMQVLAATKTVTMNNPVSNSIDSKDGVKPFAPYSQTVALDILGGADLRGHIAALENGLVNSITIYRIVGADMNNPPYALVTAAKWSDTTPTVKVGLNAHDTAAFSAQVVWLKLDPYNVPLPNTNFLARNEQLDITFDAALGYVHHVATKRAKIAVTSAGDFSVQMADINGLGLDTSRLFLRTRGIPRVSQWDGLGSTAYRVGYRSFIPRLRVTNGIVYVDFKRWVPYGYTGTIAQIYFPTYDISVYYIPAIKSF